MILMTISILISISISTISNQQYQYQYYQYYSISMSVPALFLCILSFSSISFCLGAAAPQPPWVSFPPPVGGSAWVLLGPAWMPPLFWNSASQIFLSPVLHSFWVGTSACLPAATVLHSASQVRCYSQISSACLSAVLEFLRFYLRSIFWVSFGVCLLRSRCKIFSPLHLGLDFSALSLTAWVHRFHLHATACLTGVGVLSTWSGFCWVSATVFLPAVPAPLRSATRLLSAAACTSIRFYGFCGSLVLEQVPAMHISLLLPAVLPGFLPGLTCLPATISGSYACLALWLGLCYMVSYCLYGLYLYAGLLTGSSAPMDYMRI